MTKWDSSQVHKNGSTYANQCDTPHKQMNKVLERYNLPRLNQEEIENMKRQITDRKSTRLNSSH